MASSVKQILIVDDNFEMLELLRSMLEVAGDGFQVLAVPSAEEGFLELLRTPFDLLITDLRLPGMSGFDLVRRVKRIRPEMPVIVITAHPSARGEKEAAELGVFRFFSKPLDTHEMLSAVDSALSEGGSGTVGPALTAGTVPESELGRRLNLLRADTNAKQVTLARTDGEVIFKTGDDSGFDVAVLMKTLASSITSTFQIAEQLGNERPLTIQYQAGQKVDLYSANVGTDHIIAIFFDVSARRGRIGTVWVFAQRAIKDLVTILPQELSGTVADETPINATGENSLPLERDEVPPAVQIDDETIVDPTEPTTTAANPVETGPGDLLDQDLGEDLFADVAWEQGEDLDLDAFWDSAVNDLPEQNRLNGLSLDEARHRGLLPPEFSLDERREDPSDE